MGFTLLVRWHLCIESGPGISTYERLFVCSPAKKRNKHQGIACGFVWEERNYLSVTDINLHHKEYCGVLSVSLFTHCLLHQVRKLLSSRNCAIPRRKGVWYYNDRRGYVPFSVEGVTNISLAFKHFACIKRLIIPLIWPKSSHTNNSTWSYQGLREVIHIHWRRDTIAWCFLLTPHTCGICCK